MLSPALFIAFLGGVLPILLWLFFWLLEDKKNPEPKSYIFFCFLAGMAVVLPLALPLERMATEYLSGPLLLLSWAIIEEICKFLAAYAVALRTKVFDEPLDAVVYMITAALGFSAAENVLFLLGPIQRGDIVQTIVTGDLRFIGATLLHTLSSATVGIVLAMFFYHRARVRAAAVVVGVILAISLHTLFNFFILKGGSNETFFVFMCIWVGIVAVLLALERIKHIVLAGRYSSR